MNKAAQVAVAKGVTTFVFGSAIAATLSWGFASDGVGIDRDPKPVNEPTFETHRAVARQVCKGPVVAPGPGRVSPDVVVVKLDGSVVLMDTGEALDRNASTDNPDRIWPIGICKSHLIKE